MAVAWTDFLGIAIVVAELVEAINSYEIGTQGSERKDQNAKIRTAAERYMHCLRNPEFHLFLEKIRIGQKIF